MAIASVRDFRTAAQRKLPRFLFDYIDGGSYDEVTLRRNVEDLTKISLRQRILRDVSQIDLRTNLFGQSLAMPIALGPVGLAGIYGRRGEAAAARAAGRAGVPFCLSTVSVCPITEVNSALSQACWFQLYVLRDRGFMRELLSLASSTGSRVLVFTVDMPVPGARHRDKHSGLTPANPAFGSLRRFFQIVAHPHWAWNVGIHGRPHNLGNVAAVLKGKSGLEDFIGWLGQNFDPSVTWKDLAWIREYWKGPLIIKGIMDPEDAEKARDMGAQGIVVSNHGGRQLDGVSSTVRALPAIAERVGDQLTVLADGGIRSGLDVVRMLALGARGVLLGRAWAYALAAGGEAGVVRLLEMLRQEMLVAMALTGQVSIASINRTALDVGHEQTGAG